MTGSETPLQVFNKLLMFTLLMVFVPLSAYFASKYYVFEGMLLLPNSSSCLYAAVCAVILVNVVIAMYVYVAWNSDNESPTSAAAAKLD